jgi:putative ABC transport system permease protein
VIAALSEIRQDVRYAFRSLARAPVFTTIAIFTLAIGIGATAAIFSVVNAVLLRPLPYPNPDRLVRVVEDIPAEESPLNVARRTSGMIDQEFDWWRTNSQTLRLAMVTSVSATLTTPDGTVVLSGARVTPTLFEILGTRPRLGRGLESDDERPGADVVVISDAIWRRYFSANLEVVGQTMMLDGRLNRIVGVMPAEFGDAAFWTPLAITPQPGRVITGQVIARLRDDVSLQEANAEASVVGARLRGIPPDSNASARFTIVRELDHAVMPVLPALRVLIVAVFGVILIACTNVANLLLARGTRRHSEIAIRRALGASRFRIMRQMLTESFVLGIVAGFLGVAFAYFAVQLLKVLASVSLSERFVQASTILPRLDDVSIDTTVLAFAAAVSITTCILFGALPALRLSKVGEAGRSSVVRNSTAAADTRMRHVLATVQIAMAMTLLVGAGLLLHSFLKLALVDPGFDGKNVLSFDLVIPDDYSAERKLQVAEDLTSRLRIDSRITRAGFTDAPPLQAVTFYFSQFVPPGYTGQAIAQEQASLPSEQRTQNRYVSWGYLRALGARLVSGRWPEEQEATQRAMQALVTRSFAQHYFGGSDPVGSTLQSRWGALTIVGVLDNLRMRGLDDEEPERIVFLSPRQVQIAQRAPAFQPFLETLDRLFLTQGRGSVAFAVRTTGDPLAVAGEIGTKAREIDPALAVSNFKPMQEVLAGLTARARFYAVLINVFGGIAAVLAVVGIYGVLAYIVGLRTNELGIRIALGASRGIVLWLILQQGMAMIALGVAAGLAGAAWLSHYVDSMLYGLTGLDTTTYIVVAVSFVAVALLAAYVPARRATAIDPIAALRYE